MINCFERKKRRTILSSSRTSTPCKSSYLTFLSPELVMHRNPKYPEQFGKRRRYKSSYRSILCNISTGHLKSSKYERACHASNSEISRIKLRENDKVQKLAQIDPGQVSYWTFQIQKKSCIEFRNIQNKAPVSK